MKTFGWIVLGTLAVSGTLYFGGFVDGAADVQMTDKGKQAVSDGLDSAKQGAMDGLQYVQDGLNKGLDKAQEDVKSDKSE